MVDDRPESQGSLPESERPKREPPTIDLEATEVKSETATASAKETAKASDAAAPESAPEAVASEAPAAEPAPQSVAPSAPVSPWIVAPVSGAVAAALVIGVGWMLGWPAIQPAATPPDSARAFSQQPSPRDRDRRCGREHRAGPPPPPGAAANHPQLSLRPAWRSRSCWLARRSPSSAPALRCQSSRSAH